MLMALTSLYLEGEEPMGLGLGTWKPDTSRPGPGHGQDPVPPPRTRGGEHPLRLGRCQGSGEAAEPCDTHWSIRPGGTSVQFPVTFL